MERMSSPNNDRTTPIQPCNEKFYMFPYESPVAGHNIREIEIEFFHLKIWQKSKNGHRWIYYDKPEEVSFLMCSFFITGARLILKYFK